jgi:hypothetical protein
MLKISGISELNSLPQTSLFKQFSTYLMLISLKYEVSDWFENLGLIYFLLLKLRNLAITSSRRLFLPLFDPHG